jgi:small subunit ribosomal protein S2
MVTADTRKLPDVVVVIAMKKEALAVREARRLGIPVIGLVDTNCDPDDADFIIPGNDDAIRSTGLIVRVLADGIAEGQSKVKAAEFERAAAANGDGSGEDGEATAEELPEGQEAPAEQAVAVPVAETTEEAAVTEPAAVEERATGEEAR